MRLTKLTRRANNFKLPTTCNNNKILVVQCILKCSNGDWFCLFLFLSPFHCSHCSAMCNFSGFVSTILPQNSWGNMTITLKNTEKISMDSEELTWHRSSTYHFFLPGVPFMSILLHWLDILGKNSRSWWCSGEIQWDIFRRYYFLIPLKILGSVF